MPARMTSPVMVVPDAPQTLLDLSKLIDKASLARRTREIWDEAARHCTHTEIVWNQLNVFTRQVPGAF